MDVWRIGEMAMEQHTWLAELCAALVEECGRHGACLYDGRER